MSNENIDMEMLVRIGGNAAKHVTGTYWRMREDIQQEIFTHVLERPDLFNRYLLLVDSPMSIQERENKLFASLCRYAAKLMGNHVEVQRQEMGPITLSLTDLNIVSSDIQGTMVAIPYTHTFLPMSKKQVLSLLPFVYREDNEVPTGYQERVGILRNAIFSCTKAQQEVITRRAVGKSYKEISEELRIKPNAAYLRYVRAALHRRCDYPIFINPDGRNSSSRDVAI